MLLGNPEVPRGGVEGPMAQEHLDRPDIDARFEQVGRKTVAQRMDTLAVRDPRALLDMIVDLLGRADGHRPLGIEARKQPGGWPVEAPVGAQLAQQTGGEQRIAILTAFPCSMRNMRSLSISVSFSRTTSPTRRPAAYVVIRRTRCRGFFACVNRR